MTRSTKVAIIAFAAGLPALVWAFSRGPDPRATGAPGDGTCANTGCHVGTPVNGGGGGVALSFSSGNTYTPGQTIRVTVTITQANPVPRAYGFQLSARLASDTRAGQAGDFRVGAGLVVICDNGNTKPATSPCPANFPVQFVSHSTPSTAGTWSFDWVAPATNVGDVIFYVAGNAANGDGNNTGDRIYTANSRLTVAAPPPARPVISPGGVISASAYGGGARGASGSWLEIYGENFTNAGETRTWDTGFANNTAPTALGDLSVTVNGRPAFLWFAVPGQVNVQMPDDPATGPVEVRVKRGDQESAPISITKQTTAPGLLAPPAFLIGNRQFVGAVFATAPGTFAGNNLPGVTSRVPRPGDILTFYGVGFGAVNPAVPAGRITPASPLNTLATPVEFRFGQTPATVSFQGLAPNFVGLYQFNVTVPQLPAGVVQLNVTQGGQAIPQALFIEIGN
jgi:uncharacterized protein (TIGR03437 family)